MAREDFAALLEPVLGRAYALALHLTRNAAEAEDLVQEAALLGFRGFATFKAGTNFRAWFLRVLTNAFLTAQRRKRPEQTATSFDELPNAYIQRTVMARSAAADTEALTAGDVARSVVARLETAQVTRAIQELPDEFRTVASLYFLDDLSYQDIAAALDIPVGTVRSRLHRGRALLQRSLWQLAEDHGLVPAGKPEVG